MGLWGLVGVLAPGQRRGSEELHDTLTRPAPSATHLRNCPRRQHPTERSAGRGAYRTVPLKNPQRFRTKLATLFARSVYTVACPDRDAKKERKLVARELTKKLGM